MSSDASFDLAVIGAGAAGLMCAAVAARRGLRVVLIDHAARRAEKIRISGGGRCNFTNLEGGRIERYFGEQSGFVRPALRAYPPERFIALVRAHGIGFHEKHKGQLFCDESSEQIIDMLGAECARGDVTEMRPCELRAVSLAGSPGKARFFLDTSQGKVSASRVAVATGGLSIPKIGATDLGYRLARQFGHRVVEPRPALVPLTFDATAWADFVPLAGVALPVGIQSGGSPVFQDDLLFTHRGLSGPAVLQASSFWRPGASLAVDLLNGLDAAHWLFAERQRSGQRPLGSVLADRLPRRLASAWVERAGGPELVRRRLAELGNRQIEQIAAQVRGWQVLPGGTEGFRKAEVTSGGVATDEIDPRSMQSRRVSGLYFIGEVLDVTGWLGGYNFQWAWASAFVAADSMGR